VISTVCSFGFHRDFLGPKIPHVMFPFSLSAGLI
jgi:hypothetical protein